MLKRCASRWGMSRPLFIAMLASILLLAPAGASFSNEGSPNVVPGGGYLALAYDPTDIEVVITEPSSPSSDPQPCAGIDEENSRLVMELDASDVTIGGATVQGPYTAIVRYVVTETVYEGPYYAFNVINSQGCPLASRSVDGNVTVHMTLESLRGTDDGMALQANPDTLGCSSNTTGNGDYIRQGTALTLRFLDNVTCTVDPDGPTPAVTDSEASITFDLDIPASLPLVAPGAPGSAQCVSAGNPVVCRVQGEVYFS